MREKKSNNGASPFGIMHVALILLCAVLISAHLMGDIYARYVTESDGGDSARVIRFGDLTVTEENNALMVAPGATLRRQSYVSFGGSEAQSFVFVKISADEVWAWNVRKLEAVSDGITLAALEVDSGWTWLKNGVFYRELSPNEAIDKAPVFANDGKTILPAIAMEKLAALENTSVSVEVIAVQANGFESVQVAWSAVGGTA